eukprot:26805-Amphidinium_carterae.1
MLPHADTFLHSILCVQTLVQQSHDRSRLSAESRSEVASKCRLPCPRRLDTSGQSALCSSELRLQRLLLFFGQVV